MEITFYSVTYKKARTNKLYNIAVFGVTNDLDASKRADEWKNKQDDLKKYNSYGISKHTGLIGTPLKGFHAILNRES